MPSYLHEGIIELFRNRPDLAATLLRDLLHVELPPFTEARIEASDFNNIRPTEAHADLVVLLKDDRPRLVVIVEVQLSRDERKFRTWPLYTVAAGLRFECEACVVVLTPTEALADWARTPVPLGPGASFAAHVFGPDAIPLIRDPNLAVAQPELAVLSAVAHGNDAEGLHIVLAAMAGTSELPDDLARVYYDLIRAGLNAPTRKALEELMASGQYQFQSDFAKKYIALGEAQGKAEGKAEAVLRVLEARGISVTDQRRDTILACVDGGQLDAWLVRAVSVKSADELFA